MKNLMGRFSAITVRTKMSVTDIHRTGTKMSVTDIHSIWKGTYSFLPAETVMKPYQNAGKKLT